MADHWPWQVKGFGMSIDGGTSVRSDDGAHALITIDGEYGVGMYASIENRPTPRLGVELGLLLGAVGNTETRVEAAGTTPIPTASASAPS